MSIKAKLEQAIADRNAINANIKDLEDQLKKEATIYVPDGVKFVMGDLSGLIYLKFGKAQGLCWDKDCWVVQRMFGRCCTHCKPKLIPCTLDDIGVGEWYYARDIQNPGFDCKDSYYLRISEEKCVYVGVDVEVRPHKCDSFEYYWKVTLGD